MNDHRHDNHDAKEVAEILDVVADRVPNLLRGLRDVLYSKESAEGMADSVATFYKKLVEAGIPEKQALEMAQGYMINLRDIINSKATDIHFGDDDDNEGDDN